VREGNKNAGCKPDDSKCHCAKPAKNLVEACLNNAQQKCSQQDLDSKSLLVEPGVKVVEMISLEQS
jgi:hypothetical protein